MSTIICNGRISTRSKYVEIIGVPELSLEPLEREYSDGDLQSIASVSGPANSTAARNKGRSAKQKVALSPNDRFHLAKAYLVKHVRKNSRLKLVGVRFKGKKSFAQSSLNMLTNPPDVGRSSQEIEYCSQGFLA